MRIEPIEFNLILLIWLTNILYEGFTMTRQLLLVTIITGVLTLGCSQKSVEYGTSGAVTGAVGAEIIGALTDL